MRILIAGLMLTGLLAAQPDARQFISVTSSGKAVVKPDTAVVLLSVRSTAPLAADALEQNKKKTQEVQAKLATMGYQGEKVKFTGNRFSPAGGAVYYPGRERPTGFDVYNNFYVFVSGPDLKDLNAFNSRIGTLLDETSKLGATPVNSPISSYSMAGVSVVAFAVKDAAAAEKQAFADAMDKADPIAQEIARRMNVKITGVASVNSSGNIRQMVSAPGNPTDDIPFEYISSSIEEVPVRVRVDIRYNCK